MFLSTSTHACRHAGALTREKTHMIPHVLIFSNGTSVFYYLKKKNSDWSPRLLTAFAALIWVFLCAMLCHWSIFDQLNWINGAEGGRRVCGNAETDSKDRHNKEWCVFLCVCGCVVRHCMSQIPCYLWATPSIWSLPKSRDCDWQGLRYALLPLCVFFPSSSALQQLLQPAANTPLKMCLKIWAKSNAGFRTSYQKCTN